MKRTSIIFALLSLCSFNMFSQVTETYEATYRLVGYEAKSILVHTEHYTISNNDFERLFVLFTEDETDSLSQIQLLRRKLLRKYGDFSISMFIWDNVLIEDDTYPIVPDFFVKSLEKGESFDIFMVYNEEDKLLLGNFKKHILICSEKELMSPQISMPNFARAIKDLHIEYPYPYIILNSNNMCEFINRYKSK